MAATSFSAAILLLQSAFQVPIQISAPLISIEISCSLQTSTTKSLLITDILIYLAILMRLLLERFQTSSWPLVVVAQKMPSLWTMPVIVILQLIIMIRFIQWCCCQYELPFDNRVSQFGFGSTLPHLLHVVCQVADQVRVDPSLIQIIHLLLCHLGQFLDHVCPKQSPSIHEACPLKLIQLCYMSLQCSFCLADSLEGLEEAVRVEVGCADCLPLDDDVFGCLPAEDVRKYVGGAHLRSLRQLDQWSLKLGPLDSEDPVKQGKHGESDSNRLPLHNCEDRLFTIDDLQSKLPQHVSEQLGYHLLIANLHQLNVTEIGQVISR